MKKKVIILYKNNKYSIVNLKNLKPSKLSKSKVKMILIPCLDSPNVFIPIKPSELYNFQFADVYIKMVLLFHDWEERTIEIIDIKEYQHTCTNIIEFINAIYNCVKFRSLSSFIGDNKNEEFSHFDYLLYTKRVRIEFTNNQNEKYVMDSGELKDIREKYTDEIDTIPLSYMIDEDFTLLDDFFYTQLNYDTLEPGEWKKLPTGIFMDLGEWRKIKKPNKELLDDDYMFYKLPEFGAYYYIDYQSYKEFLNSKRFEVQFTNTPISKFYDKNYLSNIDIGKRPTEYQKMELLHAFNHDEIYDIMQVGVYIDTVDVLIITLAFFNTIFHCKKYISNIIYSKPNLQIVRNFVIFTRSAKKNSKEYVLTEPEITYKNIIKLFVQYVLGKEEEL